MMPDNKRRSSVEGDEDEDASPRKRQAVESEGDDDVQEAKQFVEEEEEELVKAGPEARDCGGADDNDNDEPPDAVEEPRSRAEERALSQKDGIKKLASGSSTQTPGIIKQVHVENFMCHKALTVNLCKNINFIHGQNGSGKSAILAAIQICLGAGARRTNRASNLKDLVRKDSVSGQAKVRVTITNPGPEGFRKDIYGDQLTIERTISTKGGYNGYKLLGEDGKEKSRSKKDLDLMLDHLNILVENPVAVLDQEESKKFLVGKDSDKYDFFLKATELERIDRTCANTLDQIADLRGSQAMLSSQMESVKQNMEYHKEQVKKHEEVGKLDKDRQKYNAKLQWERYHDANEAYEETMKRMTNFREKARKHQDNLTQAEEMARNGDAQKEAKAQKVTDLAEEATEQAQAKKNAESQLKELLVPHARLERQVNDQVKLLKKAEASVRNAQAKLNKRRAELLSREGSKESKEAKQAAALQEAEIALAEARGKENALQQAVRDALNAYEKIGQQVSTANEQVQHAERNVSRIVDKIRNLEASSGDALAVFGPRVTKVARMVEEATRGRKFKGRVVGPIGAYIKIRPGKEHFAKIAEVAMTSSVLDRFIVTDGADLRLLQDIRSKAGCVKDCNAFKMRDAARYNVPGPPVDGIETVASVLIVNDDLVFNCLVDHAKIEQRALALDRKTGEEKLLIENENRFSVRGGTINECYFLPRGDHWTVNNKSKSLFCNEKENLRGSIGIDTSRALDDARQECEQLKSKAKSLKISFDRLDELHTKHHRDWNKHRKESMKNVKLITDITAEVDNIKGEIDTAEDIAMDTTEEEGELAQAEQALEHARVLEADLNDKLNTASPDVEKAKEKVTQIKERSKKVLDDLIKAEKDLVDHITTQTQTQDERAKKQAKLDQYLELVRKHQANVTDALAERDALLLRARVQHFNLARGLGDDLGPPGDELEHVETVARGKGSAYMEAKLKQIEKRIKEEKKRRQLVDDDCEMALEKFQRAKEDYESKLRQLTEAQDMIEALDQDVALRMNNWSRMRKHLMKMTSMKFDELLAMNKYSGTLHFDVEANTLGLQVQKDSACVGGVTATNKDVKALSGGERSHTTICLLLALGEQLETPFRILDEFDVFMDAQVRKTVIQKLVKSARCLSHRQFIFITPQDLSMLSPSSDLVIHKLAPPTRHNNAGEAQQQTLGFSQQT